MFLNIKDTEYSVKKSSKFEGWTLNIPIHWTLMEIRRVGGLFQTCAIMKVVREDVLKAHKLAQFCRKAGVSL